MLIQLTQAIDDTNRGIDVREYIKHKSKIVAYLKYIHTDSWRGYYSVVPASGYKILEETDWVTEDWGDAPEGHSESEVFNKLEQLATNLATNKDIFVVFTPTSNVFSTTYTVLVKGPRVKKGKKLANNTYLKEDNGVKSIILHDTTILVQKDNKITINTGGWDTNTTRNRINKYLPQGIVIFRYKAKTYLSKNWNNATLWNDKKNWIEYKDGLIVEGNLTI